MRMTRLRGLCPDTITCPTVYLSDRTTLVLQGKFAAVPSALLRPGQIAVEMPLSLLPELASRRPSENIRLTNHDTVIIMGPEVADVEAIDQLRLPADEGAVELPLSVLPELITDDA